MQLTELQPHWSGLVEGGPRRGPLMSVTSCAPAVFVAFVTEERQGRIVGSDSSCRSGTVQVPSRLIDRDVGELLMNYLSELVIAVLAGFATQATRIYLMPLLHARWRGGVPQLKGTWTREHETLTINQYGTTIRGTAELAEGGNPRRFIYRGTLMGGQAVLTWKQSGGEGIVGAMVVKLTNEGRQLKGMTTYVDHEDGKVTTSRRVYTRAP